MTKTANIPKHKTNRAHERLMAYWNRSVVLHGKVIKNRFGSVMKLSDYKGKPKSVNIYS